MAGLNSSTNPSPEFWMPTSIVMDLRSLSGRRAAIPPKYPVANAAALCTSTIRKMNMILSMNNWKFWENDATTITRKRRMERV